MQDGRGVGRGAKPQYAPADPAQAVERRARPVIIVPRRVFEQIVRKPPARAEAAGGIVGDLRPRQLSERLGQIAHLVKDRRVDGIEWRGIGEQRLALRLGPLIHPVEVAFGAEDHQQRALGPDCADRNASITPSAPPTTGPIARNDACTINVSPAWTPSA